MNTHRIILGDCIKGLKTLADQSVNTCITSPPYFGLRDYKGGDAEIGCEASPEDFVRKMVEVFREVHRVLRDDGTLWLNLGDSYASNGCYINSWLKKEHNKDKKHLHTKNHDRYEDRKAFRGGEYGIKAKDLMGVPWRVALALQTDGWYLRQDIIWQKPNPMPESVEDRCTKAHEYIFLLSKTPDYYFDRAAVAERDTSVWCVKLKPFRGAHFATFPVDLILPAVLAGCPERGTVLDPFTGSGTTAVAALTNRRNFVGCELNPDYIKIAETRIAEEVPNTLEGALQ